MRTTNYLSKTNNYHSLGLVTSTQWDSTILRTALGLRFGGALVRFGSLNISLTLDEFCTAKFTLGVVGSSSVKKTFSVFWVS